jgi:hypothetical protein
MYYCENLTWNIIATCKSYCGTLPEKKSHDINENCQITLEVLYDQITYHVYNNLAKFHQNWPLIIMHVKYKMYVDKCIQYCTCTHKYYCENLTWNINDIKDNLQIDKAFDIGQLLQSKKFH